MVNTRTGLSQPMRKLPLREDSPEGLGVYDRNYSSFRPAKRQLIETFWTVSRKARTLSNNQPSLLVSQFGYKSLRRSSISSRRKVMEPIVKAWH